MRAIVVTAAALVGLAPACSQPSTEGETAAAVGTETETETETESETETETETESETESETETETETESETEPEPSEPPVDPSLLPVEGEAPPAAVARCEATAEPDTCVMLALDEAVELRARERQRVIEAHRALGNEARMLDHMEKFVEDYPRDRRGNRYRITLRTAGRI